MREPKPSFQKVVQNNDFHFSTQLQSFLCVLLVLPEHVFRCCPKKSSSHVLAGALPALSLRRVPLRSLAVPDCVVIVYKRSGRATARTCRVAICLLRHPLQSCRIRQFGNLSLHAKQKQGSRIHDSRILCCSAKYANQQSGTASQSVSHGA